MVVESFSSPHGKREKKPPPQPLSEWRGE